MNDLEEKKRNILPNIDYSKTIIKQRIVYKKTAWVKSLDFIGYACSLILIITFLFAAYQGLSDSNYILSLIGLACVIWIIISYVYMNKTVKMNGANPILNKEDSIEALKSFYDDLTFDVSENNILRDFKLGYFGGGRVVTIIFHENDVYFHKITLGRGNGMYPINGPIDYLKIKKIAKYFHTLHLLRKKRGIVNETL